jgi:hypothetical protein
MKREITGSVCAVYRASNPDSLISAQQDALELTFEGVIGDKHYGYTKPADLRTPHYTRGTLLRNSRQISALSEEDLRAMASAMNLPEIKPEWLGANILFSGIPSFTFLPPSTHLFFPDDCVLVVQGENHPCSGPAKIIQAEYAQIPGLTNAFPKKAMHLRGIVAWVERPGRIKRGDLVRVQIPEQRLYSFSEDR